MEMLPILFLLGYRPILYLFKVAKCHDLTLAGN